MGLNYKKLGGYIRQIDLRNSDASLGEDSLYGISVTKEFIISHANLVGVTFDSYKVVAPRQFAYIPDTSRRGDKIAISLNMFREDIIVSSICSVFEIIDENQLLPEYLMLWFMRPEFDRYARFMSNGSAREVFDWDCMCGVELPVPPISEQRKIVHDYKVITDRIELLRKMNENLEEQIQAVYYSFCSDDVMKPSTVGNVALNITDGVHNTVIDDPNGEYLLLSCKNIKGGHLSVGKDERTIDEDTFIQLRKRTKLEEGDILLSSVGTIGEMVLLSEDPNYYEFQRSVAMIKPNRALISPEYLFATLKAKKKELIQAAHGAVQQCVFISDIAEFPITIANEAVITEFTNTVRPMFRIINDYEKERNTLFKMQTAILQRLAKGA